QCQCIISQTLTQKYFGFERNEAPVPIVTREWKMSKSGLCLDGRSRKIAAVQLQPGVSVSVLRSSRREARAARARKAEKAEQNPSYGQCRPLMSLCTMTIPAPLGEPSSTRS